MCLVQMNAMKHMICGSKHSCGKAAEQGFGRYFRLPHCFQAHCAGDLASAGRWHSSRVPTAFPCPWPGGERLRCRVPWGTCT
jgi:hypothetical protein